MFIFLFIFLYLKENFEIVCNSCILTLKTLSKNKNIINNQSSSANKKQQATDENSKISNNFKQLFRKRLRQETSHQRHDRNRSLSSDISVQEARINKRNTRGGNSNSSSSSVNSSVDIPTQEFMSPNINKNIHNSQEAGPSRIARRKAWTPERNTLSEEESDEESRRAVPPDSLAHVGPKIRSKLYFNKKPSKIRKMSDFSLSFNHASFRFFCSFHGD